MRLPAIARCDLAASQRWRRLRLQVTGTPVLCRRVGYATIERLSRLRCGHCCPPVVRKMVPCSLGAPLSLWCMCNLGQGVSAIVLIPKDPVQRFLVAWLVACALIGVFVKLATLSAVPVLIVMMPGVGLARAFLFVVDRIGYTETLLSAAEADLRSVYAASAVMAGIGFWWILAFVGMTMIYRRRR